MIFMAFDERFERIAAVGGNHRSGLHKRVRGCITVRHDLDIAIEPLFGVRQGEVDALLASAAFYEGLAPGILLHGEFRRDPRPPALTPAVAVGGADLDAETVSLLHCVTEHREPLRAVELHILTPFYAYEAVDIEHRGVCDSLGLHCLKIFGDTLLGDIPVHPVPPGGGMVLARRGVEAGRSQSRLRRDAHAGDKKGGKCCGNCFCGQFHCRCFFIKGGLQPHKPQVTSKIIYSRILLLWQAISVGHIPL